MGLLLKSWKDILIGIILVVLLFKTCGKSSSDDKPKIQTVSKTDTFWKENKTPIVNVYPTPVTVLPAYKPEKEQIKYLPDTNYAGLLKQFNKVVDSLLTTKIYNQTYKQDSSSITIQDTVKENRLYGRSYKFDLKYPVVTNSTTTTITLPPEKKVILFAGGGINGSATAPIQSFDAGLLLKNKRDNLYGIKTSLGVNGISYGIQYYLPIKLKKK